MNTVGSREKHKLNKFEYHLRNGDTQMRHLLFCALPLSLNFRFLLYPLVALDLVIHEMNVDEASYNYLIHH